jgi:hypothetical protein
MHYCLQTWPAYTYRAPGRSRRTRTPIKASRSLHLPLQAQARSNMAAGATWSFPASLLEGVDKVHTLRVTVSKGVRSSSAQIDITPKAAEVPSGTLMRVCSGGSCPQKHRPQAPLTLQLLPGSEGGCTRCLQACCDLVTDCTNDPCCHKLHIPSRQEEMRLAPSGLNMRRYCRRCHGVRLEVHASSDSHQVRRQVHRHPAQGPTSGRAAGRRGYSETRGAGRNHKRQHPAGDPH